jgi:DNA-binding GntR family transcriptional regulator
LHEVIARFFERAPEHFSDWQETQPHTASHHLALVEAIRDRDASRAHDVLSHHLAALVSHR